MQANLHQNLFLIILIEVRKMSHLIDKPVLDIIEDVLIKHLDGINLEQDMIL